MNDEIDELSRAVGDGTRVNWDSAESRAHATVAQQTIRALRNLARIASFHHGLQQDPDETVATPIVAPIGGGTETRATSTDTTTSERWGTFTLLERIGAGAVGEVWRAWDASLHREVAVKFIRAETAGVGQTTLLEEARALARVRHPNVVAVYGMAELDGRAGIWMEFLRGPTLSAEIQDKGALPWRDVARMGRDLGAALESLEENGLVHCDVKPSNVVREPGGRVVLTDFGLGWRRRVLTDSSARLGVGTPLFMAPSLLAGGTPTPRTDLYALGVTLRWALTGKAPFKAQSLDELKDEAGRGPAIPMASERPDAPESLRSAIERAMDVSTGAPPYSAAQMGADLQQVLDESGEGSGRTAGRATGVAGASRSRKWVVAGTAAILLAGLGWGLWTLTHGGFRLGGRAPLRRAAVPAMALEESLVSISPDGRLTAFTLNGDAMVADIVSGDARVVAGAKESGRTYHLATWHPDGKRLVCVEADSFSNAAVSLIDLVTGRRDVIARLGRLSADALLLTSASLSPDGSQLAFRKNFSATALQYRELWVVDLKSGRERRLVPAPLGGSISPPAWSPTGTRIAYVVLEPPRKTILETCSLEGDRKEVLRSDDGRLRPSNFEYLTLLWLKDGRLVYTWKYEPTNSTVASELRTLRIDPRTGVASPSSKLLYRHPGAALSMPSATGDGRALSFLADQTKSRVELLDLRSKAVRTARPTLAADEEMQSPVWSRDGHRIFLTINHSGNHDLCQLDPRTGRTESFLSSPVFDGAICLTPSGLEVLCRQGARLVAIPEAGGETRVLTDSLRGVVLCAVGPGRECVLVEHQDSDLVVRGFDPKTGTGPERFRVALGESDPGRRPIAALSPDGSRIAVFKANHPNGMILDARTGKILRHLTVLPDAVPQSLGWSHDGRDLFVTGMSVYDNYWLIRMKPDGTSDPLLLREDVWMDRPVVSPDGQSIALTGKRYSKELLVLQDP